MACRALGGDEGNQAYIGRGINAFYAHSKRALNRKREGVGGS